MVKIDKHETKHGRADSQITGMAGEFLVAGKLFKRKLQVALTLGNAKAIDIFVHNPRTDRTFNVQVKALREKGCFLINPKKIKMQDIYVFVFLHSIDKDEEYFIVPGENILKDIPTFFGKSEQTSMPAINYGPVKKYKNNWDAFEQEYRVGNGRLPRLI